MSDDAAHTADGRLFYARGAATENDRLPRVDRLMGATIRVAVADERSVGGYGRSVASGSVELSVPVLCCQYLKI